MRLLYYVVAMWVVWGNKQAMEGSTRRKGSGNTENEPVVDRGNTLHETKWSQAAQSIHRPVSERVNERRASLGAPR